MSDQEELIKQLVLSPHLAHRLFFGDAHSAKSPKFHREMISDWHSQKTNVLTLAFRGAAKSTLAEEAITIIAALGQARNCVILGDNEERAADRLRAVKYNFETNEFIATALNVGPGDTWHETKATLSNGTIIQSLGRQQSLRGVKHIDARPDLLFGDDLEDDESVLTPEARLKVRKWWTKTVIPAMEPWGRMRIAATPLHPEALAPSLAKAKHWFTRVFPIIYKGDGAEWVATWPERYPVEWALAKWEEMKEVGEGEDFVQEYLCQATDPASQDFREDMFRIVPRARSYHAVYAAYDPARTTNKQSATTGKAVCSWIGNKLVVWECWAKKIMPDEIINDLFDTDERYAPVAIGFEENGLNEWALQPIRTAQVQRGYTLPLRPLSAPKGKFDFIRGLQPYFKAGEVEFATDMPDLRAQLLGFPRGHIDAPNALAYMLKMKLGVPIYENFREELIDGRAKIAPRSPAYLCLNTDGRVTTGVLAQVLRGRLTVYADWLYEGDAAAALPDIFEAARLELPLTVNNLGASAAKSGDPSASLRPVAPREHFDEYGTLALRAVARRLKANVSRGGDVVAGREELRSFMRRIVHDAPALALHPRARWTLRALAGGYAKNVDKAEPTEGAYAVLMAGLESFAGLLKGGIEAVDSAPNYAYTPEGRRYISALAT